MHYVVSDIHNDNRKFEELLGRLSLSENDCLYILGDFFDRADYNPDPVGVYFNILKLGGRCRMIRGNHDDWLARYILRYYETSKRKRKRLAPYDYNTFGLLTERLTQVDIIHLAEMILEWPLQECIEIEGIRYLLAHAKTSHPHKVYMDDYYMWGEGDEQEFLNKGIDGYISVCGHQNKGGGTIWKNRIGNVYICDCGSGDKSGRLGCLCLETKEEIYV